MTDWNLPPGVTVNMLPGCSKQDELFEAAYEKACEKYPEYINDEDYMIDLAIEIMDLEAYDPDVAYDRWRDDKYLDND